MIASKAIDIHRLFAEAFNSGKIESLLALYEPDALFVPQPGQVLKGSEGVATALKGFLSFNGKLTLETDYVVEGTDISLLRGHYTLVGTDAGGQPVELRGKTIEVARKQTNGGWLFAIDHPSGAE
jgi:uncharacterized protein (TIGR02246 family)